MWIKHNHALYNTDDMKKVEVKRTKIVGIFFDGEEVILGEFRATKEAQDYLSNVTRKLLAVGTDKEGVIIRDTKEKK